MGVRSIDTGTTYATNWVDVTSLILFISTFIVFIAPSLLFPFHWLGAETIDWVEAWMIVNIVAEVMPALVLIFWFWYFIVAIGSGIGEEYECVTFFWTEECTYNKTYVTPLDGWLTWFIYMLIAGGSYFTVFWFAGDAVRYLRPQGGYNLFYLWPSLIYDLLVIVGVAPETSKELTGYNQVFVDGHKHSDDHSHDDAADKTVEVNVNVNVETNDNSSSADASADAAAEQPENVEEGGDDIEDPNFNDSFIATF